MKVRCNSCGAVISIDGLDIDVETLNKEKGDFASSIECPECKKRIYVEISNMYTATLNRKLIKQTAQMERMRKVGKFSNSLYNDAMKNVKKLKFTQAFLQNRYKGKIELAEVVRDESEV